MAFGHFDSFSDWATDRLRIDVRSLAVFRVSLGLVVLVDLAERWPLASVLTSRRGVLPWHPEERLGLLQLGDTPEALAALFVLTAAAATFVILGALPRLASGLLWTSLASLHARNPWMLDGGDQMLRWLALWYALLTLECGGGTPRFGARVTRWPAFAECALLGQTAVVYLTSVVHKARGISWRHGSAVADALGQSLWARPLGEFVARQPDLVAAATYGTLLVEFIAPLLLFSPFFPRRSRLLGVALLLGLQFSIACMLRMNLFPWVMTLGLVPFLPGDIWPALVPRYQSPKAPGSRPRPHWASILSLVFALQALLSATSSALGVSLLPKAVQAGQYALGLGQDWGMYSPNPYSYDFGLRVVGRTSGGVRRVIDPGKQRHPFQLLDTIWSDYRGGMYLEHLTSPNWPRQLDALAAFLAAEWSVRHGERLVEVSLDLVEWEKHTPDDTTITPLRTWHSPTGQ